MKSRHSVNLETHKGTVVTSMFSTENCKKKHSYAKASNELKRSKYLLRVMYYTHFHIFTFHPKLHWRSLS